MCRPSGDQAGPLSQPRVRRCPRARPRSERIQIDADPKPSRRTYAMRSPSGETAGSSSAHTGVFVSRRMREPSGATENRSPSREKTTATDSSARGVAVDAPVTRVASRRVITNLCMQARCSQLARGLSGSKTKKGCISRLCRSRPARRTPESCLSARLRQSSGISRDVAQFSQVIPLADNFRSHEAILNFVNPLFASIMKREIGGVEYDESAHLQFGNRDGRKHLTVAEDSSARVELHLRQTGGGEEVLAEHFARQLAVEVLEQHLHRSAQ